jgi:hypothetical protein
MILNLEESVFFLQFGLVLHPIPMYWLCCKSNQIYYF